jgi:predicted transcriptional regulator
MARPRKIGGDLATISAERARLQAELARLDEAEKVALETERDAGREVLLAALDKVKIARMDRGQAKAIAQAISALGADEIIQKLGA